MMRREKIIALCVVGVLGFLGLLKVLQWAVQEPFDSVHTQIAGEQERARKLKARLAAVARAEEEWKELTTRADEPDAAREAFRDDMHHLLELHGLSESKISPGTTKYYNSGVAEVPLNISATGTLKEVVGFLCDFYKLDYLVRLEKVRLTSDLSVITSANMSIPSAAPASTRPSGPGRGPARPATPVGRTIGPEGPELKVNISAMTLVVPKDNRFPPVRVLEERRLRDYGDLSHELEEYDQIAGSNLFKPYQEPVIVEKPPEKPPTPVVAETKPTVVEDPRKGADKLILVGVTCFEGQPTALVLDQDEHDEPLKKFHLDEKIDDGVLLLVCHDGVVVEVREPSGGDRQYFYPLGESFASRQVLSEETHPEIVEELKREFLQ